MTNNVVANNERSSASIMIEACEKAKMDAIRNVNGVGWAIFGFFFSVIALLIAALIDSSPHLGYLENKSREYIYHYRECYRKEARNYRMKKVLLGTGIAVAIWVLVYLLIIGFYGALLIGLSS